MHVKLSYSFVTEAENSSTRVNMISATLLILLHRIPAYFAAHELKHLSKDLTQHDPYSSSSGRLLQMYTYKSKQFITSSAHLFSQSSRSSLSVFCACAYTIEDITRNSNNKFPHMDTLKNEIRDIDLVYMESKSTI